MRQKILTAIIAIVLVAVMLCNVGMYISVKNMTKDDEKSQEVNAPVTEETQAAEATDNDSGEMVSKDSIKAYFGEDGEGTLAMLRNTFKENIVYYDGQYRFADINTSLKQNELVKENFGLDENNFITYSESGKVISKKGIDVSKYQGDIDWKKVKADGIDYAIIRVGYRGYGSGLIVEDENAKTNMKNANAAGVKIGVYFFSQAINEKEAVEEAEYVAKIIKKYDIDYPVVFDTEEISGDTSRTEELSVEDRTDITIAFCDKIEELGYKPMVYANIKWFVTALDMARLEKYDKWYAYYDSKLYFPYKISMWQYSDSGDVDGISGNVDMNISFE